MSESELEKPAPAKCLSADHLRQIELLSLEIKLAESQSFVCEEKLKTKRVTMRVAELEATVSAYELAESKKVLDNTRKRHGELLSSLKPIYGFPDRWSYNPDTGEISSEG